MTSSDGLAASLNHFHLTASYPSSTTVWTVVANGDGTLSASIKLNLTAYALCSQ